MALFSDPADPPGLRSAGRALLASAAPLVALLGWATLALGLVEVGSRGLWLCAPGLAAGFLARRWPVATAVVEVLALAGALALLPLGDFALLGGLFVVVGRALVVVVRRASPGDGPA